LADITQMVLDRLKSGSPGTAFALKAFEDLGNHTIVGRVLRRLIKAGKVRRICRGVFDIPRDHPTFGPLSPDPDAVARAIAAQAGYRLQPTPLHAANVLSLSSQVPAQIVYLVDGSSRLITVGDRIVHLRHAGPKALLGAGTPAGVALQAIRAFGPDHINEGIIARLREVLSSEAKSGLRKLAPHAPLWIASVIEAITADILAESEIHQEQVS
jgi:Family of unknown function (DUF6088)